MQFILAADQVVLTARAKCRRLPVPDAQFQFLHQQGTVGGITTRHPHSHQVFSQGDSIRPQAGKVATTTTSSKD